MTDVRRTTDTTIKKVHIREPVFKTTGFDNFRRRDLEGLQPIKLPAAAEQAIAAWRQQGKAVFITTGEPLPIMECENCFDLQQIIIRFAVGPMKHAVAGHKPMTTTYTDDQGTRWWQMRKRAAYACPVCAPDKEAFSMYEYE